MLEENQIIIFKQDFLSIARIKVHFLNVLFHLFTAMKSTNKIFSVDFVYLHNGISY